MKTIIQRSAVRGILILSALLLHQRQYGTADALLARHFAVGDHMLLRNFASQNRQLTKKSYNIVPRSNHDNNMLKKSQLSMSFSKSAAVSSVMGCRGGAQLLSASASTCDMGHFLQQPWLICSIAASFLYALDVIAIKLGLRKVKNNTFQITQIATQAAIIFLVAYRRTPSAFINAIPGFSQEKLIHFVYPLVKSLTVGVAGFLVADAFSHGGSTSSVAVITGSYPALACFMSIALGIESVHIIKILGVLLAVASCTCFAFTPNESVSSPDPTRTSEKKQTRGVVGRRKVLDEGQENGSGIRNCFNAKMKNVDLRKLLQPWVFYSITSCFLYALAIIVNKVGVEYMNPDAFSVSKTIFQMLIVICTAVLRNDESESNVQSGLSVEDKNGRISPSFFQMGFIRNAAKNHINLLYPIGSGVSAGWGNLLLTDAFAKGGNPSAVAVISGSYPALAYLMSIGLGMESFQAIKTLGVSLAIGSCYAFALI